LEVESSNKPGMERNQCISKIDQAAKMSEHLVADGRVEVGGEEESEKVIERGRRRRRGPGDEAGDPPGRSEHGEDALNVGGGLALDLGEEAAEAIVRRS
jgi:hypothetical protein